MADATTSGRDLKDRAEQQIDRAANSDAMEKMARAGYVARGVVYLLVGVLTVWAAINSGRASGTQDTMRSILEQPFGWILLGLIALGLICFALWRFVQTAVDPEERGTDAKGLRVRIGYAISGVANGALALQAAQLAWLGAASRGGGDGQGARDWTAKLMSQPFGVWLVGLLGAGIIVYGLWQLYRAYADKLSKRLDLSPVSPDTARMLRRISRAGLAARGVVFLIIGGFLIQAAMSHNPSEAGGLGEALHAIATTAYGPWLLALVALGLAAYGIYQFVQARYRRIGGIEHSGSVGRIQQA